MFDEFVCSQFPVSSSQFPVPNPVSSIQHPASSIQHPASGIQHPASSIQHLFTEEHRTIKLHGHCHQKALASVEPTIKMLTIPQNYKVEEIKSGCCGMAGSFGYEKEHYDVSMKIGELVLFPEIRKSQVDVIIAAPGTSCRHQIKDGTGRTALHPIEVLYDALVER
jgi:Fe-S oxidoreductase